jgi:hypothetical protein
MAQPSAVHAEDTTVAKQVYSKCLAFAQSCSMGT